MGLGCSEGEMCAFVAFEAFRQGGTEPLDRTKHQTHGRGDEVGGTEGLMDTFVEYVLAKTR